MTMDISNKHIEYISLTLESHVVTYHTMARALGLHITDCKTVLSSYYRANKSRVSASFIATGTRHGHFLVRVFDSETDLAENCESVFDMVNTVHVYCLSSNNSPFSSADIASEERKHLIDMSKLADYHSSGLIEGPELIEGPSAVFSSSKDPVSESPIAVKSMPSISGTSESVPTKTAHEPEKPKLVYQSRKQQPKASMLSNYVSRKGEKSASTMSNASSPALKRPSSEKPQYEYKSRKLEKSQPKERVVVSSVNEDDDLETSGKEPAAPKATISNAELENLFLDDFTDEDEKDDTHKEIEIDQPIVVEHAEDDQNDETAMEIETKTSVSEIPLSFENDIWKSIASKTSSTPEPSDKGKNTSTTETTVDEEGYFVSYKQNESKTEMPPKPSREPTKVSKPVRKPTGKTKQSSVMSFFQKR